MKNGFTLVEFISIMVVVSVMTLVSAPLVSKELKDVKVKSYKHMGTITFPIAQ